MSVCLSVCISAAPTGRTSSKSYTGVFYENLSRNPSLGQNRPKISDTIHEDLGTVRFIVIGDINSPWKHCCATLCFFILLTVACSATVHTPYAARCYHVIRTPPVGFCVALSMRDSTRHSNCICRVLRFRCLFFCFHWGTHFETIVQNSVLLSTIFGPQRKEVTEGLTELHSEVRHSPYVSLGPLIIKSMVMRWGRHGAHPGGKNIPRSMRDIYRKYDTFKGQVYREHYI